MKKIIITEETLKQIQKKIETLKDSDVEKISDGYHTFEEVYDLKMMYNATLFNLWAELGKYDVHKSKLHNDGEKPFGGGYFIVVAKLPKGQISNHYKLEFWDLFKIPTEPKVKFKFDNHTDKTVISRLKDLYK